MEMGLSSEQAALQESIHEFLTAEYPIATAKDAMQSPEGYSVEIWRKMASLGWLGIALPEQYGGGGLGLEELAIMYEQYGRGLYQGPHFASAFLCGQLVLKLGSELQKQELLVGLASGRLIASLALLEEDVRWEEPSVKLRAQRTMDGWSLTGTKLFVTHAIAADELLCAARDVETGGTSLFRIRSPKELPISPMPSTFGNLYYEVEFRDILVPNEDILGSPGNAWPAIQQVLDWAIGVQCAEMVGLSQSILDMSATYAKQRVQFGHPIGAYQGIQHVLADMISRLDASRLLTYQAVSLLAEGLPAGRELAMAKAYVNESAYQIALDGMQVHGGIGYMVEHPLPHFAERVLYSKMNFGDTDVYIEQVAQSLGI